MEAGQTMPLEVVLDLPSGGAPPPGRMQLSFDAGSEEVTLVAELSAPGFRVAVPRSATLHVLSEPNAQKERATFLLTALDPGPAPKDRAIDVSFWRDNECVGGITHTTVVVPKGYTGNVGSTPDTGSPIRATDRARESADLVFYVKRQAKDADVFDLDMRSRIAAEEYELRNFGSFDLGGKGLAQYLSEALDPSFDVFPGAQLSDADFDTALVKWNGDFLDTLKDLGSQLWLLLPEAFRTEYLRLAGLDTPPRSIFVFSDELAFPWEIVRPSGLVRGQYAELPVLGVSHVLGRWKPGTGARPQPQTLSVSGMALLLPDANASGLPGAQAEALNLLALVPKARQWQPLGRRDVDALLASTGVQLVHFSGHGDVGANADLTHLSLENGEKVTAVSFAASKLCLDRAPSGALLGHA